MQPSRTQRRSTERIPRHLLEEAGRQLLELGSIPSRYEEPLREAMSLADEAEREDLKFYFGGRR